MGRQTLIAVLAAAMLVLAGCAGSTGGGSPTAADSPTQSTGIDDDGSATGTVNFYVSDDPGQIDDFQHLNVTITRIGFERADGGEAGDRVENESTDDVNETEDETREESDDGDSEDGETEEDDETEEEGDSDSEDGETEEEDSETEEEDDGDAEDGETEEEDGETEGQAGEAESDAERGGGDGWVTHDVNSRTVDLTRLKGDNATLIDSPELPAGNYSKVFVYVSDINATLKNGTSANVKLPSEKLQLNRGFTLEPNGTVSFVYDVSVFKAGNSGKYILKPVVSQSGPDVNVEDVDGPGATRGDSDEERRGSGDSDSGERGPPGERTRN